MITTGHWQVTLELASKEYNLNGLVSDGKRTFDVATDDFDRAAELAEMRARELLHHATDLVVRVKNITRIGQIVKDD